MDSHTSPDARLKVGVSSRSRAGVTIAFACVSMFVSYLPFSAVNGILGTLGASAGASTSDLQWCTGAFALALAATVLPAGAMSERIGRRSVTVLGLGLTAVGGLLAITAGSFIGSVAIELLWAALAVAGIGGGAVMSASLALINAAAGSVRLRRRGIAVWAACITGALGTGPFLAAAVLSTADWQWVFLPIVILASATGVFGLAAADEHRSQARRRPDIAGQLLSALTICAVVLAVITGGATGWASVTTWIATAVAVVGLVAFLIVESVIAAPMLPLRLFSYPTFTAAGIGAAAMLFSIVGAAFTMSLLFAHSGSSDLQIATSLGCMFAANALASIAAAPLQTRFHGARLMVAGLVLAAIGAGALAAPGAEEGFVNTVWRLVVFGLGSGLAMTTASASAVAEVPDASAAVAGAANNTLRQIGATLGVAVLGAVLTERLAVTDYAPAVQYCLAVLSIVLAVTAVTCSVVLAFRRH